MKIKKENKQIYKRFNINLNDLKEFYIDRANHLLKALNKYSIKNTNDLDIKDLKDALTLFISNPKEDLKDVINRIETSPQWYNDFSINDILFDINFPNNELIEAYKKN